jgi:hypothetical protein
MLLTTPQEAKIGSASRITKVCGYAKWSLQLHTGGWHPEVMSTDDLASFRTSPEAYDVHVGRYAPALAAALIRVGRGGCRRAGA